MLNFLLSVFNEKMLLELILVLLKKLETELKAKLRELETQAIKQPER